MMMCFSNVPGWLSRIAQSVRIVMAMLMMVSAVSAPVAAQEQPTPAGEAATTPPPSTTTPSAPAAEVPPAPSAGPGESAGPTAQPTPQPTPPATSDQATPDPAVSVPPDQASGELPAAAPAGNSANTSHLPRDLSPWGMFMAADLVVKAVMIGLAFASVVTWTVWLAKTLELTWAKRRLTQSFADINAASSLAEAAQRLGGKKGIVSRLIELAAVELHMSADVSDKAGIKERVTSRLDGLSAAAGREMNRGTGVLATIGSTSPFVGLFGTVWGIMNSFIGISEAQTTNLAIVAPGIAEALLATAMGLVAAIPAVIIYNHFARQIGGYRAMIGEVSSEVLRLVSRDLDRGYRVVPKARAAE
jgi:biopolymer transport protein ExbB